MRVGVLILLYMKILFGVLVLSVASVKAQTFTTETFGSGTNQFSIEFVEIKDVRNSSDTNGLGAVDYEFSIGKYEINRDAVLKINVTRNTNLILADMSSRGANGPNYPATGLSWFECAQFVNSLNESKGIPPAYKFDQLGNFQQWTINDVGFDSGNPFRNKLARYVLPSIDEWYKAAFYDPTKNNVGGFWKYPTKSDTAPLPIASGTNQNSAVYLQPNFLAGGELIGPAEINNAGSLSYYGTMAQGGNVWEIMETASDLVNDSPNENRILKGGDWSVLYQNFIESSQTLSSEVSYKNSLGSSRGFRIAMKKENVGSVTNTILLVTQKTYDLVNWAPVYTNIIYDTNSKAFYRLQIEKP